MNLCQVFRVVINKAFDQPRNSVGIGNVLGLVSDVPNLLAVLISDNLKDNVLFGDTVLFRSILIEFQNALFDVGFVFFHERGSENMDFFGENSVTVPVGLVDQEMRVHQGPERLGNNLGSASER